MNPDERECMFDLDASASPVVAVSQRLAVARGQATHEFALELRAQHADLASKSHSPIMRLVSPAGAKWTFAIARLEARGQVGELLIAVLTDEETFIDDIVKRVHRLASTSQRRFLQ